MNIPTWLQILIAAIVLIAAAGFVGWMLMDIVNDVLSAKLHQKFEEDLLQSIKHSQPTWEQLVDIALTRGVKQRTIYLDLRQLMREILTGRNKDAEPHKKTIEDYISNYKDTEPFEGLPNEIIPFFLH